MRLLGKLLAQSAIVVGAAGILALGVTSSQARDYYGYSSGYSSYDPTFADTSDPNSSHFAGYGYTDRTYGWNASYRGYRAGPYASYDPTFADTSDPNSVHVGWSGGYDAYAAAPGYDAYAGAPGFDAYAEAPGYGYRGYHAAVRSVPHHYDPGYGYNSNTIAPWQDRKLQGIDY